MIMTLRAKGNPEELERLAAENADTMPIARRPREGARRDRAPVLRLRRRLDHGRRRVARPAELPGVLGGRGDEIEPLMQAIGVTTEPEVTFWRKLESHDEVGWES